MEGPDDAAPPDLKFPCLVFDIAFHPTANIVAAALVSGSLQLCVHDLTALVAKQK